jgi:hypothetical protein
MSSLVSDTRLMSDALVQLAKKNEQLTEKVYKMVNDLREEIMDRTMQTATAIHDLKQLPQTPELKRIIDYLSSKPGPLSKDGLMSNC